MFTSLVSEVPYEFCLEVYRIGRKLNDAFLARLQCTHATFIIQEGILFAGFLVVDGKVHQLDVA